MFSGSLLVDPRVSALRILESSYSIFIVFDRKSHNNYFEISPFFWFYFCPGAEKIDPRPGITIFRFAMIELTLALYGDSKIVYSDS